AIERAEIVRTVSRGRPLAYHGGIGPGSRERSPLRSRVTQGMDPLRVSDDALERRTQAIGRELFDRIGTGPRISERGWWDDRLMSLALDDPEVRVQLFRFIDAMPALHTDDDVCRHLAEYLAEAGARVPWWLRLAVAVAPARSPGARLLAAASRVAATHMAH